MKEVLALYKNVTGNYRPLLNGERYLTDREVAEVLKVSRRTLQEYRNDGVLPYILLGGKVLYRESDLERSWNHAIIRLVNKREKEEAPYVRSMNNNAERRMTDYH